MTDLAWPPGPEGLALALGAFAGLSLLVPVLASALPAQAHRLGLAGILVAGIGALALTLAFAGHHTATGADSVRLTLGHWDTPLGIALHLDGLTLVMLLLNAVVALAGSLYALGYIPDAAERRQFWPLWLWLWGGLNLLLVSGDVFNIYITLEIVSLSAVALVAFAGSTDAVTGAMRYLLVNLLGSLGFLLGVALLFGQYGVLDLQALAAAATLAPATHLAAALMLGGLLMKAAVFPLHVWLATAHSAAPAPVSGMLSGLVVAAMFYLVLRLWLWLFAPLANEVFVALIGLLGVAALLWGSLQALRAPRLKIVAAYSTVAQMGYIALVIPLLVLVPRAWPVAVFFALAHGLAKAAILMAAGTLQKAAGHDRMNRLGRTLRARGRTVFAIGLAGVSLMGLPLTGGFIAKYLVIEAGLRAATGTGPLMTLWVSLWVGSIVLGGLFATAYVLRMVAPAFQQGARDPGAPVAAWMEWAPLALAVAAVLLGLLGNPTLALLAMTEGTP
ncbi:MAG: complex I subunit 5 family protein [Pseudomonadota bacterium]